DDGYKDVSRNSEGCLGGESEGAIRATKGGNAPRAKGPCFSDAFSWRRHGVIAEKAQHTHDQVRVLQRKLYRAAKEAPQRKFGVLYDKVHRRDVLEEAWR